ncbi:MAG: alpha-ribazole phosphatase [Crocinitomicaceae bacterium]|nr:alpha-ribazole phosphatase [Crocinitomicaceae bacterium]
MELVLIRHTTPAIEKGICYGQSDLDVADSFEAELMPILKELGRQSKVYSSPLKRCRLLAERIGEEVVLDDRLMEMNFGDWELQPWSDIPKEEIQPWYDDFVNVPAKNGESLKELSVRVESFLNKLIKSGEQKVVCFTHAGIIRIINGIIENLNLKQIFDLKLTYGEIVRFSL